MKRSVASAILIGVSLFVLHAYITAEGNTPPVAAAIDALPLKSVISTHVPTDAFVPDLPFSLEPAGASLDDVGHGRFDARGAMVTQALPATADLVIEPPLPLRLVPAETTVYTLTLRNRGPALATGILLTNTFANGVVPVGTEPAQPWCDRQDRSVRCSLGDLRPSDTTAITLDLSVGGTQNHVTNTQLAGVTLDLSTPNCVIDMSHPAIMCRLARLAAGADVAIRVGARVDAGTAGRLVNRATITANELDPNPANNTALFTMTVGAAPRLTVTPVPSTTDLVMRATGPASVVAGQPFTYTYTITNRGELDATGVHFEDALPSIANLYGYSPGLPVCEQRGDLLSCSLHDPDSGESIPFTLAITGTGGQPVRISPDQPMPGWPICTVLKERTWLHIVKCELGTLKHGQTTHVQLGLVAIGLLEHPMTNSALVRAREAELSARDNTITSTMAVHVRTDLTVRSALAGPASAGKPLSYTLTIDNLGPSDADGVVLTDTLPTHTRFVSAVPSQGDDCRLERKEATPGAVVCRLGPLSGGAAASVRIDLGVDELLTAGERILHSAKVASEQPDPNLHNNELSEWIPVRGGAKE